MFGFRFWLIFFLSSLPAFVFATHNRAGEITYRHLGAYRYEVTITTYTKADSQADRPSLGIHWGDGTSDTIPRVNGAGSGDVIAPDLKKNVYLGTHIYPGPSTYTLYFEDPNRNGGVINIPNSVNIPFYVSTTLILNPFLGINNSVQLLNPPIDKACPGQIFIHNPGAWDPDGDSLSYRLVQCLGEGGQPIPGFSQPPAALQFSLDPVSGDLIWNYPPTNALGEYNVAFVVEEWRNGRLIGSVTRDMQIDVVPCSNTPPHIEPPPSFCVLAGEWVQFPVRAWDADFPKNLITLSANGGAFLQEPPNQAEFAAVTGSDTLVQQFRWKTSCAQVRKEAWQISFRVSDNGKPPLADYQNSFIRVIAPAPELAPALAQGNSIQLNWSESACNQAIVYDLYRKAGPSGFNPANCLTGLPASTGFVRIASLSGINQLNYVDSAGLRPGQLYCYRVVARFPDGAESYASNEVCVELKNDLPLMTHVSIRNTASQFGSIQVSWVAADDLDTVQWPGPYLYEIERRPDITGSTWQIAGSTNATSFVDSAEGLNTESLAWHYRIALRQQSSMQLIGRSIPASSVFLRLEPEDNAIRLRIQTQVPWNNFAFTVYRKSPGEALFDSIAQVKTDTFLDKGLANNIPYCYRIRAMGSYGDTAFPTAFLNFSQEVCAAALDLQAPCSAVLMLQSSCDSIKNKLSWSFPPECLEDIVQTRLWFKPTPEGTALPLEEWADSLKNTYTHQGSVSIAGCYRIESVDSAGNTNQSHWVCADNCPEYRLPNVFSPNNDGQNDMFKPYPYAFIAGIRLDVFNRWGKLVFHTENPDILWNGRDQSSGNMLPDGVYFYICRIDEIRLSGIVSRTQKGQINIIGSNGNQSD